MAGQNAGKLGICWAGGLERGSGARVGVNNVTGLQEASLVRLIRELLGRHPGAKAVGHRALAATQCPGFDVIPWWAAIERPPPVPPALAAAEASDPTIWLAALRRAFRTAFAR